MHYVVLGRERFPAVLAKSSEDHLDRDVSVCPARKRQSFDLPPMEEMFPAGTGNESDKFPPAKPR